MVVYQVILALWPERLGLPLGLSIPLSAWVVPNALCIGFAITFKYLGF